MYDVNLRGVVSWTNDNNYKMKFDGRVLNKENFQKLKDALSTKLYLKGRPVPKNRAMWNSIKPDKSIRNTERREAQRRYDYTVQYARTHQNARFEPWQNSRNRFKKVSNEKLVRKVNAFGNIRNSEKWQETNNRARAQRELLNRLKNATGTNRAAKLVRLIRESAGGNANYNRYMNLNSNNYYINDTSDIWKGAPFRQNLYSRITAAEREAYMKEVRKSLRNTVLPNNIRKIIEKEVFENYLRQGRRAKPPTFKLGK